MNQLTHDQIAELVIKAQAGDQQAFGALYTATVDRQLYFATAFLKDPILAEDVVQDIYIKLFKSLNKLQNPKVFVAYLNRICYNACVDYKKKHSSQKYELNETSLLLVKDDSPDSTPEDHFEIKETNTQLYAALSALPDDQRTAFMLRYYNDLKIKEISESMELSESTVKRYINGATKQLREQLATVTTNERG